MDFTQKLASICVMLLALQLAKRSTRSHSKPDKRWAVGVDFGGTKMKLGLVDCRNGQLLNTLVVPVASSKEPIAVVDQILDASEKVLNGKPWAEICALGVCCPGRVENGIVSTVANLKDWKDIPLRDLLRKATNLEHVAVVNDANAALQGEMWHGGASGCRNVVMLTIGTGVGGAVATDGKILRGATGMFGEIGHHIICMNGRLSAPTNVRGIAEEYCSIRGIQTTWKELSDSSEVPEVNEIFRLASEENDELALRVLRTTSQYCGVLIVNACRVYDPECIVLGGGLASHEWFVDWCREEALNLQWSLAPPSYSLTQAIHGNWAGAIGAAQAALHASG